LGAGYRGSAYSNLAELRSLLEQKTAALAEELEEDFARQTESMAGKLLADMHGLREELQMRHQSVHEQLLEEETQRIRAENTAKLEEISAHFHVCMCACLCVGRRGTAEGRASGHWRWWCGRLMMAPFEIA
jgi:hypothetical protein